MNSSSNSGINPDSADLTPTMFTQGAQADADIFLEHLLGIRLDSQNPNQVGNTPSALAERITQRIVDVVDVTRAGLIRQNLRNLLDERIAQSLTRVHEQPNNPTLNNNLHTQRIAAIADAVREVIPTNVLTEFVRNAIPAVEMVGQPNVPPNHVRFSCEINGILSTVEINMMHSFWRETQYQDPQALKDALKGKKIGEVGLVVRGNNFVSNVYRLDDEDVDKLIENTVTARTVNTSQQLKPLRIQLPTNGTPPENPILTIDVPHLVRASFDGKKVAEMNVDELQDVFENSNVMARFVTYEGTANPFNLSSLNFGVRERRSIADAIFNDLHSTFYTPTDPLLVRDQTVFEIQANVSEQHRNFTRLREGSSNPFAAAMAASLIMQHKDLDDIFSTRTLTDIQTDVDSANREKRILDMLQSLGRQSMPSGTDSWEEVEAKIKDINTQIGTISINSTVTIGIGPNKEDFPVGGTIRDVDAVRNRLSNRLKELNLEVDKYRQVDRQFRAIYAVVSAHGAGIPTNLLNLFTISTTPITSNQDQYVPTMDLSSTTQQIAEELNLKTANEYTQKLADLKKEKEDLENGTGGIHGDKAQHEVLKQYLMRYKNMTDKEAQSGANYLRARSMLDADLASAAEDVSTALYGSEQEHRFSDIVTNISNLSVDPNGRSRKIIHHVGRFAGVPIRRNNDSQIPDWNSASYDSLMTAYFAMKKLYEGTGHNRIKLQQTSFVQSQMREISKLLLKKHLQSFIVTTSKQLSLSNEEQAEMLQDVNAQEHVAVLKKMLSGDVPNEYKSEVDSVVAKAEQNVDWLRRNLLTRDDYGMLYGKKNKISARNILYGNKYLSAAGLYYRLPKAALTQASKGVSSAMKEAWKRKGAIATGALIGTLFLPGIGTAIGASIGAARKPQS